MKRIYIAGPMTGLPELNFPAFHAAAKVLRAQGHHVENPAKINADPKAQWIGCMRADIARLATFDAQLSTTLPKVVHVVSLSGGKDSLATALIALARCPAGSVLFIFCDTGNEHEQTYAYLDYLEGALGVMIHRLRADFTEQLAAKRVFIARDVRHGREYRKVQKVDRAGNPVWLRDKAGAVRLFPVLGEDGEPTGELAPRQAWGWDGGRKVRWSNKAKRRALSVMFPSGNPFLDLCMWKGRFPSRKAQFCTEELKRNMAVGFQLELIEAGHRVVSWQGVRRDESENRRNAKKVERVGRGLWIMRPIELR